MAGKGERRRDGARMKANERGKVMQDNDPYMTDLQGKVGIQRK